MKTFAFAFLSCLLWPAIPPTLAQAQAPESRKTIRVPGAWDAAAVKKTGGFAWYRTWVEPDPSFFTKHERNLYEESVSINVRDLAGAHEVFVNGKKIGTGGKFPPDFRDARAEVHRHKVPVGTLRPDSLRQAALAPLTAYSDTNIGKRVTDSLPQLKPELQLAAFTLLASRAQSSIQLLEAGETGKLQPASVPENIASRLRESKDHRVVELASRLLDETQIRDFFAYLRISQPISK